MPTVPNLEAANVQAEPLPGRPNPRIDDSVSPADFGSGVAQGAEEAGGLGAQLQEKANAKTAQADAKLEEQNNHLRVIDSITKLDAASNAFRYGTPGQDGKLQGGAYSLHGASAINLPGTVLPQFDQAAQAINAGLSPDQQALFAQHIANSRQSLDLDLNRHEYENGVALANEVFTNSVKQSISNASVAWRDPEQITKSRLDIKGLMDIQGDRQGWSPEEKAEQTQSALAEMHFNVVDRMLADGKPNAALSYFKGIRDTNELTGHQAQQLGASIDTALNQNKAQNQSALLSQMRDASTAAMNGLNIPPSSMPSKGALLAAFPEDGQRRWDALQSDISMGATLKGMSTLSAADLQKTVDGARPTQVAGAADQFERYNTLAGAASKIIAQRNADPRQAVIDNKLGSVPLNFQNIDATTAELKSRLAATQTDSERFGRYVPPLSNQEASQFAQRLQTMSADDRAKTLGSLNSGLANDKGFQTLMHQVMPGSPVTAIVGSQINQSSPSNTPVWMDRRYDKDPTEQIRTLAGEALLNPQGQEKAGVPKIKLPPDGTPNTPGMRDTFAKYAGDTFQNRPELAEAMFSAFKANYAQRLAEAGNINGEQYDDKMGQAALQATVGHHGNFNGQTMAVPAGLDPSRFESVVNAAVNTRAKGIGLDVDAIKGYRLEELGAPGSGRYKLISGNAPVLNPSGTNYPGDPTDVNGKGIFTIDVRNQYMPGNGAKPTEVDERRQAAQTPTAEPTETGAVPGTATKVKDAIEKQPDFKAPAVTGTSRGRGKAHPSQADLE